MCILDEAVWHLSSGKVRSAYMLLLPPVQFIIVRHQGWLQWEPVPNRVLEVRPCMQLGC